MKKILLIAAICLASISAKAQDYNWAIGVRGGGTSSDVNLKHILADGNAFEISAGFLYPYNAKNQNRGTNIAALYEWNAPLRNDNFILYAGFGGHIGTATVPKEDRVTARLLFGVDGVAGIEYKLPNFPIAFSLDWRPFFEISTLSARLTNGGIGVKFCF